MPAPSKKRRGRRRPRRSDGAAPSRRDDASAEPIEKVAPWSKWKRLALRASPGTHGRRVTFTVSELDPRLNARYSALITSAADKYFKSGEPPREGEGLAAYLVGGRLRVVFDELIVRFEPHVPPARCSEIVDETGFVEVQRSRFTENQWIVRHARPGMAGEPLLSSADTFARFEEVRFAWPNSVAEYSRASDSVPKTRRWWLDKIKVNHSTGKRRLPKGKSSVVIAVLDDGVDIDHPNLASRVAADPGRDFAVAANQPDHADPRPKVKTALGSESDYHGTLCAGLICSDGSKGKFFGVAPGCTLVAVRVIDGPELISELSVADAISYATGVADVISCSWIGEDHAKVVDAINDTILGRGGKGCVFVGAAGNDGTDVDFPARHSRAIAVGACGPGDEVTPYSNFGDDLDIVAPSSMDDSQVYSTDVSKEGWGFDTGLFWDEFGETSAAAAVTAGVAALCLSANPNLMAAEVRSVIQDTAIQIGKPGIVYGGQPAHCQEFGCGCINAAAAVAKAKQMLNPQPRR